MAHSIPDSYQKAMLDMRIKGENWQKTEAFDEFTRFFNETITEE